MLPKTGVWSEALVNRNLYPEQPGLPQDSSDDKDGANYLRRLKGPGAKYPSGTPGSTAALASVGIVERRQSHRLRCSGSVEFQAEGSDARMWGTLTDISLHGCYVEMSNTFPVDTKANLVLKSCGLRIQTAGTVRAAYPALGMGIRFERIEPAEQTHLKRLLALLAGHISVSNPGPAQKSREQENSLLNNALDSADKTAFFDQIQEFFQGNHLLSRDEFHAIAKRVRRT
jgi:hypothetical protein